MADSTRDSEDILNRARQSLATQRNGGRHRLNADEVNDGGKSIGHGSAELKRNITIKRIKLIAASHFGIVIAASVAGIALDGIGFTGVMVTFLAIVAATILFSNYPKVKVPKRSDLNTGDVRHLVSRTELWLEHQRPSLPPQAAAIVDKIGVQLDALALQLETIDPAHPSSREVRKLVGEHLPEMVESYQKVPVHLRKEQRAGAAPDEQLADGLGKISTEIDSVTRQLADGAIDNLAIRTRYLDYRYGAGPEGNAGSSGRTGSEDGAA